MKNSRHLESTIDFSRFAKAIINNGWKLLLVGLMAALVSYPLISRMVPKYVATATVLIKAQQDNVSPLPSVDSYDSTRTGYYETQYTLMESRIVLERAVKDLKLDENPVFSGESDPKNKRGDDERKRIDRALGILQGNLTVTGIRTTQLVSVSYESASPELSAHVANGVALAFINHTAEQKHQKTLQAKGWNQQQMELLKQQIVRQKTAIDEYLYQEGLLTFRGVDGFETEQLGIVTNKLADATERRIMAETEYSSVRQSLRDVIALPEISNHAQIQDLRIAMVQAKRSLYELRQRYGPKHTRILEAEAQNQAIRDQTRSVLVELEAGLRKQYQAALADEKYYQQQLDQQKERFQDLAAKRDEYNNLTTALNKTEELYKMLYQRAKEQEISGSYLEPNALLYDPAVPAEYSSKPNKALLMLMVVMLALIFAVVCLIVKTALDNTINSISQMKQRLNLQPLGEIRIFTDAGARAQIVRLIINDPLDADIIHSMRTHILLANQSYQTIAITSAEQGEGRSLLAHLLANSFSFDQKTLLIDLDFFNNNGLIQDLVSPSALGMAELLQGQATLDDALVKIRENLAFLPRGTAALSSLLMLSSEYVVRLIVQLRMRYQRIIVDVAAVNQTQDIQLISRVIDGVIFVIKAGALPAGDILSAVKRANLQQTILIGVVMNQVSEKNLETKEGLCSLHRQMDKLINSTRCP